MPTDPSFRMAIEDVFTIRGRGTIVTGRIERGVLEVGDFVWINKPNGVRGTEVTGIEMFRRKLDRAGVGDYVGVVLQDIGKGETGSGDVLAGTQSGFDWGSSLTTQG